LIKDIINEGPALEVLTHLKPHLNYGIS